jgi:hypothetical protein
VVGVGERRSSKVTTRSSSARAILERQHPVSGRCTRFLRCGDRFGTFVTKPVLFATLETSMALFRSFPSLLMSYDQELSSIFGASVPSRDEVDSAGHRPRPHFL